MSDSLTLKWGTLKAWNFQSEAAKAAAKKYSEAGPQSLSAMAQYDNEDQKRALVDLIDALDCDTVCNGWDGSKMTKEEAKKYVMEYGE